MDRMLSLGTISRDEHQAAEQILRVFEIIERDVSIGSVSLEARVDYSGSANDYLAETLGRIRAEYTYAAWRNKLVKPPGLVIDMITTNQSYVGIARRYRLDWKTARKRLLTALRLWNSLWIAAKQEVTADDVNEIYLKIGEGILLQPKNAKGTADAQD